MSDAPLSTGDLSNLFFSSKEPTHASPVAPDDDPEFLARLDAQNRRRAYEQRKAHEEHTGGHSSSQSQSSQSQSSQNQSPKKKHERSSEQPHGQDSQEPDLDGHRGEDSTE